MSPEEAKAAIDKAGEMISALCKPRGSAGAREWMMTIPARSAGLDALNQNAEHKKVRREAGARILGWADALDEKGMSEVASVMRDEAARLLEGLEAE